MTTGGDRVAVGTNVRSRREALGLTQAQLAVAAGVGTRTLAQLEAGEAGWTRLSRVERALDRLERGEDPTTEVVRWQIEPGVWITLSAEDAATMRSIKAAEERIRNLLEDGS